MDALFVAIVATFSVGGCFKGLVKSFCCLIAFLIALLFAFYITKAVVPVLEANGFLSGTLNALSQITFKGIDENLLVQTFSNKQDMIDFIKSSNITNFTKNNLTQTIESKNFEGSFTVFDIVAPTMQKTILSTGVFLIFLLVMYGLIKTIILLATKVIRLHFLVFTNRVAGFIFGSILGIVICLILIQCLIIASAFLNLQNLFERLMQSQIASNYYKEYGIKLLNIFI